MGAGPAPTDAPTEAIDAAAGNWSMVATVVSEFCIRSDIRH
jgi:hypothetical protein